ncbi:hypothetical protein [Meiothermus cerbereus]|uniref:hypothetical protein n=1 Tax=Meiothermus cerbereus TaxID=65552 RepID=UPI0004841EDA|nr:hypothetical protein [Meiothermus cerbereus]
MESLGHYLLRERIALPGVGAIEAYEGQDVRTGIDVLAFKPLPEQPPKLSIPHTLSWIDQEEDAWIAEIPVGAVKTAWLAGRVDVVRLTQWCKQLLGVLNRAQESSIPVGCIIPELIWARGSRVWLGGVGVPNPVHRWDFGGLLNTVKVLAGDAYPALPWRAALEDYVAGRLDYADLVEQLEAEGASGGGISGQFTPSQDASSSLETLASGREAEDTSPATDEPKRVRNGHLEARRARAQGERVDSVSHEERASSSLETLASGREAQDTSPATDEPKRVRNVRLEAEGASRLGKSPQTKTPLEASSSLDGFYSPYSEEAKQAQPEAVPEKPAVSKSLNVQVNEPSLPTPTAIPPRRIRIEERLEPPFEVLEPPSQSRRAALLWLWLIPLLLLLAGAGLWIRSRNASSAQATAYPVEFRLQPPGPSASLVILEIPEGSKMPLNTEVAQLPGRVDFDKPGVYRIRVRVQGRVPVESLIEVPNPGGVTISLR